MSRFAALQNLGTKPRESITVFLWDGNRHWVAGPSKLGRESVEEVGGGMIVAA